MRIAVPAILSPDALTGHNPRAPVLDLGGRTMGTTWHVRLAAPADLDRAELQQAIEAQLTGLVAEMSHWEAESILGRFNRAAAGTWIDLPDDFGAVMKAALEIAEATGGAFDPAIGALANLWGFGPVAVTAPPSHDAIAAALAVSGWRRLDLDTSARRLRQPGGLRLDLSGIAKGYAVDAVAALLAERGLRHGLVEIGGELAGRGLRPDGEPWWVNLETPAGIAPFRIALHDLAVATSGDYVRGEHTLDPATGRPATHGVMAVSVLHASAMHADAWASALTVLGEKAGMAHAARENLACRFLTRTDAGVREAISPALDALL